MDCEDPEDDEMLPEYDFRGGVRGKHARAYRQGHTIKVHHANGTTVTDEAPVPESHRAELDRSHAVEQEVLDLLDAPASR